MKNCKLKHKRGNIIVLEDTIKDVSFNVGTQILTLYVEGNPFQIETFEIDLSEMKLNAFKSMILKNFLDS